MLKQIALLILFSCSTVLAFAQQKPKAKEKPVTQKEVDDMMKEIEGLMNDPETRKAMEAQGVKMPDLKKLPRFDDKQYAAAEKESKQGVPARDARKIAAINRQALTDASLKNHLLLTQTQLEQAMRPEMRNWVKGKASAIIAEYGDGNVLAQIALNCHIAGLQEMGAYLMCKASIAHPGDPGFLNNYAAMLNAVSAQHLALPILNTLNAKYPRDYVLINNIGQAWYGLGDMQMAEKYIDSAIILYPRNPQALHSKSKIETKKRNKEAAKKALEKSLEEAYSSEKEYELRQLGGKMDHKDATRWTMAMPKDVFGLSNFATPEFPMSIRQSEVMKMQWESFRDACKAMMANLRSKRAIAEREAEQAMEKRQKEILSNKTSFALPWLSPKAQFKLRMLQERDRKNTMYAFFDAKEKYLNIQEELGPLQKAFDQKVSSINDAYPFGEGQTNNFPAHCAEMNKAIDHFLSEANSLVSNRYKAYITQLKVYINERAEYALYANFKEDYEVQKLLLQEEWLTAIQSAPVQFHGPANTCPRPEPPKEDTTRKLSNFYDRNCDYVSEFIVPFIGKWTQRCDIMIVELKTSIPVGPASIGLGGNYVINSDTHHENGSIELGVSVGVGPKLTTGITGTGMKVEGKSIIHLTDRGITDIELGGSVGVKSGLGGQADKEKNLSPVLRGSLTHLGAEGKFSIMNGPPASGKIKFMDFKF